MAIITIKVTGLDEAVSGLNAAANGLPSAKRAILQQASQFMANELRRNAHVVSGRMKDSIQVRSVSNTNAVVAVSAPYAVYENARPGVKPGAGPHNFGDMAVAATQDTMPSIVESNMASLFRSTVKKAFKYTHKTIGKGGKTIYHYGRYTRSTSGFRSRFEYSD